MKHVYKQHFQSDLFSHNGSIKPWTQYDFPHTWDSHNPHSGQRKRLEDIDMTAKEDQNEVKVSIILYLPLKLDNEVPSDFPKVKLGKKIKVGVLS